MTDICPATGREGACPWLALESSQHVRLRGWTSSGAVVASLLAGVVLLAAPAPPPEVFAVAVTAVPIPAAPALTAMSEPAPEVTPDPALDLAPPVETDAPPRLTQNDRPPDVSEMPSVPMPKDSPDHPPVVDSADPPLPQVAKPKVKPTLHPKKTQAAKPPKPQSKSEVPAPATSAKVSGTVSPKAWADAVVKQIRKTARRTATGRGTVQIGFTVGKDGSLQAVKVLTSSGVAQVDAMGMDHIRRAAPFPAPPTDANRNLAFVFELQ